MASQAQLIRDHADDRFPMVSLRIRTDGENKRYEVAFASDVSLFQPDAKPRRAKANFYSSRAAGLQPIRSGEAVYILPPEILARFVGREKLYYALVTYSDGNNASPEIAMPSESSAYIDLKGLTGRSLKRVRVLPSRQRSAASYGNGAGSEMEWGGDVSMPGTRPATSTSPTAAPTNGKSGNGTAATAPAPASTGSPGAAIDYKDGFGPMPAAPAPAPAQPARDHAAALSEDIPLDPGIGGVCISADALEIGDIIISTTADLVSRGIRIASGSQVSHSMLYVGQGGQVIEAVGSGVRLIPLEKAIESATVAVAVRRPDLTPEQGQQIADAAAAYIGRGYNYLGIVRQAQFQIHSRLCSLFPAEAAREGCRRWYGMIDLGTSNNREFFCSELITSAYAAAGVPLTTTPPNWTTPEDLAEMFLRTGALAYVGHLKTPPVDRSISPFDLFRMGMGLGDGNGAPRTSQVASRAAYAKGLSVVGRIPVEQARPVQLPRAREADTWERMAIEAGLAILSGPMAPAVTALRALASSQNLSVGIGPAADVGFQMGLGIGGGVIIAPGGRYGIYGHLDVRAGIIDSASVGLQVTIVRGGIEAFNEVAFAVGGAFVEGLAATVEVLFNPQRGFIGVSFGLGVGLSVEPFELFVGIEASVSQQVAGAQALSNECYSLNWDEVELIPQPTSLSCWATAGAMVIGWRDRMSVSPELVAQIGGRSSRTGISPDDHCAFGTDVGLVCESPQCYNIDGFRALLENYGPLWVGVLVPASASPMGAFGHAVVVTGMYSDGDSSNTFVRITDPLDRVVGSPGAPGSYLSTHNTGSRYIMSWADFTQEYEQRATSAPDGSTNFQILRTTGTGGRQPRRSGATGYAMSAATGDVNVRSEDDGGGIEEGIPDSDSNVASAQAYTRALSESPDYPQASRFDPAAPVNYHAPRVPRTINRVVIHINDGGTKVSGTVGWFQNPNQLNARGKPIHVSAHYIVGQDGEVVQVVRNRDVAHHASSANGDSIGIEHIANPRLLPTDAEYCASAALTRWLCDTYNLPIDRTHVLGHSEADPQTTHTDCPNAVWNWEHYMELVQAASSSPTAQAAALSHYGNEKLPPPPAPVIRALAMDAGSAQIPSVIKGALMERVTGQDGNITWQLDQLRGLKHPDDIAPAPAAPLRDATTIRLNDWPHVDFGQGVISAWFCIDWQFNGKSVGNVRITSDGTSGTQLSGLSIEARIMDDPAVYPQDNPTYAAVRVSFTYRFRQVDGSDMIAKTNLQLLGDGTYDKRSTWERK